MSVAHNYGSHKLTLQSAFSEDDVIEINSDTRLATRNGSRIKADGFYSYSAAGDSKHQIKVKDRKVSTCTHVFSGDGIRDWRKTDVRRASNRNVMAWTFMGNTRMHQVLEEKGNKLSHVGIFTFEVSADGTISETGTSVSTILPYVKKWPHIKWLLTIMNHGTASIFTALRENTNGAQDTFISEIVRIIDKYSWCSGIDIDLERGGELANREKANALFSRIYSTVKTKGASLHVNICLPGMTSVGGSVGGENGACMPIWMHTVTLPQS